MGIYVGENPLSVPGMSAYQEAIKGGFAGTREDFDKALKDLPDHLADEVRHITAEERASWNNKAPGGFGLGGDSKILTSADNLDTLMTGGLFQYRLDNPPKGALPTALSDYAALIRVSAAGATCVQEAYDPTDSVFHGTVLRRTIYGLGAGAKIYPWEWVNPPMQTGVEYRTTERYLCKPVYVKLIDCGNLPDGTTKEVAHGIANIAYIVGAQAIASNWVGGFNGHTYLPCIYGGSLTDNWTNYLVDVDVNKITVFCGGGLAGCPVYVTFKYTKTTD